MVQQFFGTRIRANLKFAAPGRPDTFELLGQNPAIGNRNQGGLLENLDDRLRVTASVSI